MGASLLVVPCNTAHYFYEELAKETPIKILNLISDTAQNIKDKGINKVGIWATEATIEMGLYQKELDKLNIEYKIPNDEDQKKLMHIIYDNVKLNKDINIDYFNEINESMKNENLDAIIMGCTELSVVKEKLNLSEFYIDPLEVEARNIIKYFNKEEVI
jgi:aspartate racemase